MKNKIFMVAVLIIFNIGHVGLLSAGPCPGKCTIDHTPNANGYCSFKLISCPESITGSVWVMVCSSIKADYGDGPKKCKKPFWDGIIIE
jgi:hypothetical protein